MELNSLSYTKKSRNHKAKVVGRGYGSGMGKRSTRGQKGQNSRKSGTTRLGFEGGQTPIYRRIPKVGFSNKKFNKGYEVFTLSQILKLDNPKIDRELLVSNRYISKNSNLPIKLIDSSNIKLAIALDVTVDKLSAKLYEKIIAAKGKINIIKHD